ncbi:sugar ABC transporter ATP-binding protein [Enemella dayhoffiae]|nr:sugar ABC transporter ATP-binding protein [Enemella dayhoffiae]
MTDAPVLTATGLTKRYGSVDVVADMGMSLMPGTIHGLMGENGAGKSTVIKMLSGAVTPSGGAMILRGETYAPATVHEAQNAGVVALPQELLLVGALPVADNIFLGTRHETSGSLIHRQRQRRRAEAVLAELGQRLPMTVPVSELSPVQQTMVAVARALAREARVLILDEPTAALTDQEIEQFFAVLAGLKATGVAILYVSHRMNEIFALTDVITVMRNGHHVWTRPTFEVDEPTVVATMIGRTHETRSRPKLPAGAEASLVVESLTGNRLRDVSFTAEAGRVLGVAGLAGSGRSELLRTLAGAQRARTGTITFEGTELSGASIRTRMRRGVALVPEERRSQALVLADSIEDNIALANLDQVSSGGVVSRRRVSALARTTMDDLAIRAASIRQPVEQLSGGNQQKVVLGKYLRRQPRLLLLDEPTRGIDVGTKQEIHDLIGDLADAGVTVLVVSSEITELLSVCDEILVLREGRVSARIPAAGATEQQVLTHCYRKPEES